MEIIYNKVSSNYFRNISFTLSEGKIVGVTGTNTNIFLKMLNGELELDGTATYGNLNYNQKNIYKIRKKINIVPKEFSNTFYLKTIEEHIVFLIKYYCLDFKNPKEKVNQALKMVGLEESCLKKELVKLSSSEKKLLQIAIALLTNPEVILFDEPFIKLDINAKKKVIRLINKLKERYNKTIVIASDNSNMLYNVTDEMFFLKNSSLFRKGKTDELYQNVEFLKRHHYNIPDLVLFTYKVEKDKNIKLSYHKDIRDLIKDVYKHV